MYLWSLDSDAVLTAVSLFRLFCDEAEIRSSGDELPPEYYVHYEIAMAGNIQAMGGRTYLQKQIVAMLRRIRNPTAGCSAAWEQTYRYWEVTTKYLKAYPKSRTLEEANTSYAETLHRTLTYRKAADVDEIVNEWANMTGFLCALGGVCVHYAPSSPRPSISGSVMSLDSRKNFSTTNSSMVNPEYCQVTEFISHLLSLLMVQTEKICASIQRNIKELLSNELNPALYPALFDQIKLYTDKLFDSSGRVNLTELNTMFLEHIIYIMRNVLNDGCVENSGSSASSKEENHHGITCIEPVMIALVRYVRYLDPASPHTITIKTKICVLVETILKRRDDLLFRQEIRFRNKS